ncbi:hypothetical protein VNI00_007868 [Paramarasmius palmivorus]|uniref:Uncharacterized protein n=1 Tax=Paramarasmius palmivorus TaxID=297713 RepID=A0AAW0CY65_9AGAR
MNEPLPPTVSQILANPLKFRAQYPTHLRHKWRCSLLQPSFLSRLFHSSTVTYPDTSIASFYRIYIFFVLDWNIAFRNELEYFCTSHPDWSISSLPDPGAATTDPLQYTILAVLTRLMCDSFNRRAEMGLPRDAPAIIEDFEEVQARPKVYEESPEWAKGVSPLTERVVIPNAEGVELSEDDENVSEEFKEMNVIVQMPHIHFV